MAVFLCPRPLARPPAERLATGGLKSWSIRSSPSLGLLSLVLCLAGPRLPLEANGLLRLATEGSSCRVACLFLPPCARDKGRSYRLADLP